jgi:hypothetical protein
VINLTQAELQAKVHAATAPPAAAPK